MDNAELARRLRTTTLFSHLPREQLVALLGSSPQRRALAGEWLADSAQGLKDHLVLLSGEVEVRRVWTGEDGQEQTHAWRVDVDPAGPGFSLVSAANSLRVQAVTEADYVAIDSEELDELLGWSQMGGNMALARHLKVFQKVPLENVQQAFERMVERQYASGEAVVTQGERGDSYYVILSGEAEVWRTDPLTDETERVAVLSDGDAFGEESLLQEGSRNATIRMISPGRLLVLSKADFDQLLKPAMVATVEPEQARDLVARGEARLLDCRYDMEYEESRIPGAQQVPLDKLREGVFSIDPEQFYVVYCRSGKRSSAATFLLRERGIRAVSLVGGIKDWPYEVDDTPI